MSYMPANGGAVLPIARLGRLGWFVEGQDARGFTWTMAPRGALTFGEQRAVCVASAAAIRALGSGGACLGDERRDQERGIG